MPLSCHQLTLPRYQMDPTTLPIDTVLALIWGSKHHTVHMDIVHLGLTCPFCSLDAGAVEVEEETEQFLKPCPDRVQRVQHRGEENEQQNEQQSPAPESEARNGQGDVGGARRQNTCASCAHNVHTMNDTVSA